MWACQYGIGVLEDRAENGLIDNVVIELGVMIATARRCALLEDTTAPSLPTDLVGQIFKPVDLDDGDCVVSRVKNWITDDLNLLKASA